MRPSWIEFRIPFVVIDYGVKWQLYEPKFSILVNLGLMDLIVQNVIGN